jgi:hypothetical protein
VFAELTLKCQFRWGQPPMFGSEPQVPGCRRYRVSDGSTWGPTSTSLALAAAQARAVALTGRSALVWADDGTSVTVTSTPGVGFTVEADVTVAWATHCRTLLDCHG